MNKMSKSQLYGNSILSVSNVTKSTTTPPATSSTATSETASIVVGATTISLNTNNNNNHIGKQQVSLSGSKLQIPQHQLQLRRSLLPPVTNSSVSINANSSAHATQSLTHPPSVTTSSSKSSVGVTTSQLTHPHQLQTVATIHHSQQQLSSQQQQPKQQAVTTLQGSTAIVSTLPTDGGSCTKPQQHHPTALVAKSHSRRNLQHLQSFKSTNSLKAPAHSIPPRYQPPPQPPNSGILKYNSNTQNTSPSEARSTVNANLNTISSKLNAPSYFSDTTIPYLSLHYPPDIPQLSTVFIPDSIKTQGGISSRYLPQRQQQESQLQQHDMLKFVRKTDQDHPSPNASVTSSSTGIPTTTAGRLSAEQNRQLQSLINELRVLKEQNHRLLDDNQELRDLCCFLDDDRQKGRKLAREWQRFGRYTASVMRQEVAAYQNKLRQLDDKQQELITDNLELKELCLYLDEERAHIAASTLCTNCGTSTRNVLRDDGDGSSSSTNADETITVLRNYRRKFSDIHLPTTLNDQTLQYVRSLERRIQQLEEERMTATLSTTNMIKPVQQQQHQKQAQQQPTLQDTTQEPISGRPEAVVRALQVLEVREQLERDRLGRNINEDSGDSMSGGLILNQMDDNEKALVREINVVWRKLQGGDSPSGAIAVDQM